MPTSSPDAIAAPPRSRFKAAKSGVQHQDRKTGKPPRLHLVVIAARLSYAGIARAPIIGVFLFANHSHLQYNDLAVRRVSP
jgi:hypothetical protein